MRGVAGAGPQKVTKWKGDKHSGMELLVPCYAAVNISY